MRRIALLTALAFSNYVFAFTPEDQCHAYEELAEAGEVFAEVELGYCYLRGVGREPSIDRARNLWESAAAKGSQKGSVNLAGLYLFELNEPQLYALANRLLEQAYEEGYQPAAFSLAIANLRGMGTQPDLERAVMLLQASAESSNDPLASLILFGMNKLGLFGAQRDAAAANYWIQKFEFIVEEVRYLDAAAYLEALEGDSFVRDSILGSEILQEIVDAVRNDL